MKIDARLSDALRARLAEAVNRRLDEVEAADRLAALVDATGKPNPAHQAKAFRLHWELTRFIDKLRYRWHACEARRRHREGCGGIQDSGYQAARGAAAMTQRTTLALLPVGERIANLFIVFCRFPARRRAYDGRSRFNGWSEP
jgi:hypothetical protein